MPYTKSRQLMDHLALSKLQPGSEGYGMSALKWMHDHDPRGQAVLHKSDRLIAFVMTDGSKIWLDLTTGTFTGVHS